MTTGRHSVPINLRFDIDDSLGVGFEPRNIDFYIEMSDATKYYSSITALGICYVLAYNCIFRHYFEMLSSDNVPVSSGCHKNIRSRSSIFHSSDFISSHSSL